MPRRKEPKLCACGCGEMTAGGKFKRSHDAKLIGAIVHRAGGVAELRTLVEASTGKPIAVG